MNYKLMHCYSKNSTLLALIDIDAISEMTWHNDGIYIYWRRNVDMCGTITTERAGCIICDWTKVKEVSLDTVKYLKDRGEKIILEDTTIYDIYSNFEMVYYKEPKLTEEDIEEGIKCSNL